MTDQLLVVLFDLSIKALLLFALADLLLRALRVRVAASSHSAWMAVLCSLLVLVPLCLATPGVSIPLLPAWTPVGPPPVSVAGTAAPPVLPRAAERLEPATAAVEAVPSPASPAAGGPAAWSWKRALVLVYLLGVGFMLARLAFGLGLCRRLLGTGREISDPELQSSCRRLCAVAGLRRVPALLASSATRVPLVTGYRRPRVLLPESWRDWDRAKLESVLAHELAHLSRGDQWTHLLVSVLRGVYWFHPVSWLLSSRLSILAEEACDELAVRWTGRRTGYARHLLEVASSLQGTTARVAVGALPMARTSQIGRRIDAVLRSDLQASSASTRKGTALALMLGLGFVAAAAAVRLEPEPAAAAPAPARAAASGDETEVRIRALSSSDPGDRARAAVELRQSETVAPRAIPALAALLGDRSSVRALVDDNEQPVGPLTLARTTPGEEAAKTLGYYGEVAVDALVQALGSKRAETRLDATTALGRARSKRPVRSLIALLEDPSAEVREMAAWALGTIGDPSALEAVTRATQDGHAEVRKMASWAQAKLKLDQPREARSFAELQADLKHRDYRVRLEAARALRQSQNAHTLDALLAAASRDSYYGVRVEAVAALGGSADARALVALRQALKDPDYRVRLQAVEGLSQRQDSVNAAALRGVLGDSDYRVRLAAASLLARWGYREGLSTLQAGLRHEHQAVRMLSVQSLGKTGSSTALEPLVTSLKDEDYRVRRSAAEALGKLGDRKAVPALTRALEDEHEDVREAAQDALQRLNATAAIQGGSPLRGKGPIAV